MYKSYRAPLLRSVTNQRNLAVLDLAKKVPCKSHGITLCSSIHVGLILGREENVGPDISVADGCGIHKHEYQCGNIILQKLRRRD